MGALTDNVIRCIREERYFFSDHADNQLRERGVVHWQIIEGVDHGKTLVERPAARPNPVVELDQVLSDGTSIKAVWAYLRRLDFAKLVTVHFYDR